MDIQATESGTEGMRVHALETLRMTNVRARLRQLELRPGHERGTTTTNGVSCPAGP